MDAAEERIKALIGKQLGKAPGQILGTHSIKDDLRADSMDFMALVMAFEDELKVEVSDVDALRVKTVQDMIDLYRHLRAPT